MSRIPTPESERRADSGSQMTTSVEVRAATNRESRILNPELYACLHRPPTGEQPAVPVDLLEAIAREFSPRFECHGPNLVSIDVSGLERLVGPPETIGEELRRAIAAHGIRGHVAVGATRTAALVLAIARPGLTIVARGDEAAALAPIHIGILEKIVADDRTPRPQRSQSAQHSCVQKSAAVSADSHLRSIGMITSFGEARRSAFGAK